MTVEEQARQVGSKHATLDLEETINELPERASELSEGTMVPTCSTQWNEHPASAPARTGRPASVRPPTFVEDDELPF